jgi:hypothetical protein
MISTFDDYPVHQTPEPIGQPYDRSLNFYDRYWFNGFDRQGKLYLGCALGLYPNRRVMDGAFSVLVDGVQHAFFASRRAPTDRFDTGIGPLTLEVVKPMRVIRLRLAPNDTGIECDLTFRARTIAYEEPRSILRDDGRVMLDTTRFTQFGAWAGYVSAGGTRTEIRPSEVWGVRDRSWGVRPVGEREAGAPSQAEPGVYWIWCVNHFDDLCTHYATFEDHEGRPAQVSGAVLPAYDSIDNIPAESDSRSLEMSSAAMHITWEKGTRRSSGARLEFISPSGEKMTQSMEPLLRFHLKGIGYQHPKWGHAIWKGELVTGAESWKVDELDPLAYENIHVHQICRVKMGSRSGIGTLEQVVLGSHKPSGFKGFLDGAP